MIGPKPLSEIRAELVERFSKGGVNPVEWFDREIRRYQKRKASPGEVESLFLLRNFLAAAIKKDKKSRRRKKLVRESAAKKG